MSGVTFSIAPYSIQSKHFAAQAVDAASIKGGSINASKILAGAVTEAKLGAGAVTEAKLGVAAVTAAKINLTLTGGSQTVSNGASWVPPAGIYVVNHTNGAFRLDINQGGWKNARDDTFDGAAVISDGVNVRLTNTAGISRTIYYKRIA